ncbi:putative non-LTR retroelement reverse transcriptase related protein, partial [Trifolium medium]|nr:putative non-LTR retroelement reverse transcriptase related protein [Trifolium medium]
MDVEDVGGKGKPVVGDGVSSLFWKDPWLDGVSLDARYARLFDLAVNKFATVAEMFSLGRGANGEAWKWRRRLFAWEEGL